MTPEQEQLFDEIYKSHFDDIKNFCNSQLNNDIATAEDITQISFSLLSAKWDTLNSHTKEVLLTWLYRTAKNIIKNYLKKARHNRTVSLDEHIELGNEIIDRTSFVEDITYGAYKEAIEKNLSKEEQQLLNYVVNDNFSLLKISLILDENVNTVKSRWLRLRKKLQKIVKDI